MGLGIGCPSLKNKYKKLKREIQEFLILERYIKKENEKLKAYCSKLQGKNDKLVIKNRKFKLMFKKWRK